MGPKIRFDDSESDDPQSGEILDVTEDELSTIAAAPGNEIIAGDPAAASGEEGVDFTIFNNNPRPE